MGAVTDEPAKADVLRRNRHRLLLRWRAFGDNVMGAPKSFGTLLLTKENTMEPWIPVLVALIGAPILTVLGDFLSRTAQAKRVKALADAANLIDHDRARGAVAELIERESASGRRSWTLGRMVILFVAVWIIIICLSITSYLEWQRHQWRGGAPLPTYSWGEYFYMYGQTVLGNLAFSTGFLAVIATLTWATRWASSRGFSLRYLLGRANQPSSSEPAVNTTGKGASRISSATFRAA